MEQILSQHTQNQIIDIFDNYDNFNEWFTENTRKWTDDKMALSGNSILSDNQYTALICLACGHTEYDSLNLFVLHIIDIHQEQILSGRKPNPDCSTGECQDLEELCSDCEHNHKLDAIDNASRAILKQIMGSDLDLLIELSPCPDPSNVEKRFKLWVNEITEELWSDLD